MNKIATCLIFLLLFTFVHSGLAGVGKAESETRTIYSNQSKTVEDFGGEISFYDPDMMALGESFGHVLHVGYEYDDDLPIVTKSVLQFDLGDLNRMVEKAELQIHQKQARVHSFVSIWGATDYSWQRNITVPNKDDLIISEMPLDFYGEGPISFDVTSYVINQLTNSRNKSTFLFEGASGPLDPNETFAERFFSFYSQEHDEENKRPKLILTFAENQAPSGEVTIEGNGYTNTRTVYLNLSATDPEGDAILMNIYNEGEERDNWESYQTHKEWVLSEGDGTKTIYVRFKDIHENESVVSQASVILDTVAPEGSFTINDGDDITNSPHVTLHIQAESDDVSHMRFSNEAVEWEYDWEPYAGSHEWTLESGQDSPVKMVYMQLRDHAGNISEASMSSIELDQTLPTGTLTINDGEAYTNDTSVYLKIVVDDIKKVEQLQIRFSNDADVWPAWMPYQENVDWNLPPGEGPKTIFMQLLDRAGNINLIQETIFLDITPPIGSIRINNDASYTNTREVILTISSDDHGGRGGVEAQFSNDTQVWTDWKPVETNDRLDWILPIGDGSKQVHMKLRDQLKNESFVFSSNPIILDTTPPTITGVVNGGFYNHDVTIHFDEGTAVLNGVPFAKGSTVSEENDYIFIVTDDAGNTTTVSFTIDKTAPVIHGVLDGAYYNEDVTITFNKGHATLNDMPFDNGTSVTEEGSYRLIVTDQAGNRTTLDFTIDKTAPIVSGVENQIYYNQDVTISFNEGTAVLNGKPFINGTSIIEEGTYLLTVTDQAGNRTELRFYIDNTAPTGSLKINGGTEYTNTLDIALDISGADAGSPDFIEMRIKNEQDQWMNDWQPLEPEISWQLASEEGHKKTVQLQLRDQAGNVSETISASIVYQSIPEPKDSIIKGNVGSELTLASNAFSFTNVDGTAMKKIKISLLPENGELFLNDQPVTEGKEILLSDLENTSLVFVPDQNWSGQTLINWQAGNDYEYSSEVAALTIEIIDHAPTWPINSQLEVGEVTHTSVHLSWQAANDDLGVVGYNIYMNSILIGSSEQTDYKITDLSPNTTYLFTIKAFDINKQESIGINTEATTKSQSSGGGSGGGSNRGESTTNKTALDRLSLSADGVALDLVPAFSSSVRNYDAVTDAEQVELSMQALLGTSKVFYEGKEIKDLIQIRLEPGDNVTQFVVRANDGTEGVYTLTIHRTHETVEPQPVPSPPTPEPDITFTDISGHWAATTIEEAVRKQIIKGYPDGSFRPEESITRAEIVVMLANALNLSTDIEQSFSDDTHIAEWAKPAVAAAVENGIVQGYVDGSFRPNERISRMEMAVMVSRALGMDSDSTSTHYNDDVLIPLWAKGAIDVVWQKGIMEGRGNNTFVPREKLTRAEAVVTIFRLLEYL